MFSPGANGNPRDKSLADQIAPRVLLNRSIACETLIQCLDNAIAAGYGQPDTTEVILDSSATMMDNLAVGPAKQAAK